MASTAQVLANRQNAINSTGPKSQAGKTIAKLNATRHGLTGQTVVLPTEDAQAYAHFRQKLIAQLAPKSATEEMLVDTVVDTQWRLERAKRFEANIVAGAFFEPLPKHIARIADPAARNAMVEVHAVLKHEKELRNLHLQEARLQRALYKAFDELRAEQARRKAQLAEALDAKMFHEKNGLPFQPKDFGFVFTPEEFATELTRRKILHAHPNTFHPGSQQPSHRANLERAC